MRIVMIRHGRSAGNEDDSAYARFGDPLVPLTDEGWRQAFAAGQFLASWYGNQQATAAAWPRVWVSSFLRAQQTASGVLGGLGENVFTGTPDVREDLRLAEQSFGFLPYAKTEQGPNRETARALAEFSWTVYRGNPFMAQPAMGEAPIVGYGRANDFIETLHRDRHNGVEDVLIVSHGATIKNFLMRWFHLPMNAWKKLQTPGNCDVMVIEMRNGAWTVEKIYDGEARAAVSIDPIAGIEKLSAATLPPLPDFLKPKP